MLLSGSGVLGWKECEGTGPAEVEEVRNTQVLRPSSARAWRLFSADWNNLKREASSAVTTGGHCYVAREKQRETAARAAARLEAAPEKKQGTASAWSSELGIEISRVSDAMTFAERHHECH